MPDVQISDESKESSICSDLTGPHPTSVEGYKCALIVLYFQYARGLKTKGPQETATQLTQVMSRLCFLGAPPVYRLHSDCGKESENAVMEDLQTRYAMFCMYSSPYDPQANARAERSSAKVET